MGEEPDISAHRFYMPFAANIAAFIMPMVTGTLSACSSGLIIYIISRSQQKLTTTYHRIMALMSAFDIISSIFIAIGTIMMPSDTMYKYAGPLLGNQVTCQIQGWFIVFGLSGSTSLNACLAWYFVCSIAFKMKASQIRKCIEPVMFIYTVIISLFVPSFYLSKNQLNPNSYDTFCTVVAYPESCDKGKWYDWNYCSWSEGDLDEYFRYLYISFILIGLHFSLIVVGMSIILWATLRINREIKILVMENTNRQPCNHFSPSGKISEVEEQIPDTQSTDSLKYTRVLIFQALMYIGSFMLTWIFTVLSSTLHIANIELDAINSLLFPLQGFWNLMIFFYDKTYIIRQSGYKISFIDAVKQVVISPFTIQSVLFDNLSAVLEESNVNSEITQFDRGNQFSKEMREGPKDNDKERTEEAKFLRNGNMRVFKSINNIRRSGANIRNQGSNSTPSIQTPKGFIGDSIASTKSKEELKDMYANVLECFNVQIASRTSPSSPVQHNVKCTNQTTRRYVKWNLLRRPDQIEENHRSNLQNDCKESIDAPDSFIGGFNCSIGRSSEDSST
jgi:hypothetical protein